MSKPTSNFNKGSRYRDGLQPWCGSCRREYQKKWYSRNREQHNARAIQWRKDNPEKAQEIDKRWKSENKDKTSQRYRVWRKKNLTYDAKRVSDRRARKLRAMPAWADQAAITAIYERARELSQTTGEPYEVDHMVPLNHPRVCGLHYEHNLQAIPARRNRRKGNKAIYPGMWLKRDVERIEAAYAQGRLFA